MSDDYIHPPTNIELQLDHCVLRLALPAAWTWARPADQNAADPAGRLPGVLSATSPDGGHTLRIAAARLSPPLGIMPAAVYWSQFHGLPHLPDDQMPLHDHPALSGWFELDGYTIVAVAWVQAGPLCIELRLDGPAKDKEELLATWTTLTLALECVEQRPEEPETQPEGWLSRAGALRAQSRLEDAIALIELEGDRAEALLMQSDMHLERMRRAVTAGDAVLARQAWQQAHDCAHAYASGATSGGEGAARSLERDRFLAELGPKPT